MPRYKLTIEYDGTDFSGWQIQPNAPTIEEELERAFSRICQHKIDLVGQGRTDAGVHARGQVAHVDLPERVDPEKLRFGVNRMTGPSIHIHSIEAATDDFHARFDAEWREYSYTLMKVPSPLMTRYSWVLPPKANPDILKACSALIKGEHDFAGFSRFNEENYTTRCTVFISEFVEHKDRWVYLIRGNRFLRNMVRRLVGTMVWAAEGKLSLEEFEELLEAPESEIKNYTAPAKGLVLESVFYPKK